MWPIYAKKWYLANRKDKVHTSKNYAMWNKSITKNTLYDYICMKCPEEANLSKLKVVSVCLQLGWGGRRGGGNLECGMTVELFKSTKVTEFFISNQWIWWYLSHISIKPLEQIKISTLFSYFLNTPYSSCLYRTTHISTEKPTDIGVFTHFNWPYY